MPGKGPEGQAQGKLRLIVGVGSMSGLPLVVLTLGWSKIQTGGGGGGQKRGSMGRLPVLRQAGPAFALPTAMVPLVLVGCCWLLAGCASWATQCYPRCRVHPTPFHTQLLDILKQHGIRCTFFIIAGNVGPRNEVLLQRMVPPPPPPAHHGFVLLHTRPALLPLPPTPLRPSLACNRNRL